MEKSNKGIVVESLHKWYDIGSWDRLDDMLIKDRDGNSTLYPNPAKSKVRYIDAKSNTVFSYDKPVKIGVVGLNNIIVAISGDKILIADKSRSNDIKKLANMMEEENDDLHN
jgi:mannose-1-phosphate guanylyltransferase